MSSNSFLFAAASVSQSNLSAYQDTKSTDHFLRLPWVDFVEEKVFYFPGAKISRAALSGDGKLLLTAAGNQVALWDFNGSQKIQELPTFVFESLQSANNTGFFKGDSCFFIVNGWNEVILYDRYSNREIKKLIYSSAYSAFSKNREKLLFGYFGVHVYDGIKEEVRQLTDLDISALALSDDGTLAAAAAQRGEKEIKIWNAETGELLQTFRVFSGAEQDEVLHISFSQNNRLVLITTDHGKAFVGSLETGGIVSRLEGHRSSIWEGAFYPDGSRVMTASWDGSARIWDVATGQQVAYLGHLNKVYSADISPDGKWIVTGSLDNAVYLWNAQTGAPALAHGFLLHENEVKQVQFLGNNQVFSVSDDGTCRVWQQKQITEFPKIKIIESYLNISPSVMDSEISRLIGNVASLGGGFGGVAFLGEGDDFLLNNNRSTNGNERKDSSSMTQAIKSAVLSYPNKTFHAFTFRRPGDYGLLIAFILAEEDPTGIADQKRFEEKYEAEFTIDKSGYPVRRVSAINHRKKAVQAAEEVAAHFIFEVAA